jgi:hypothetical protein
MHANARRVRKSGDDSNRDSNVTTHRAIVADDDDRDREGLTHRPVPCKRVAGALHRGPGACLRHVQRGRTRSPAGLPGGRPG